MRGGDDGLGVRRRPSHHRRRKKKRVSLTLERAPAQFFLDVPKPLSERRQERERNACISCSQSPVFFSC